MIKRLLLASALLLPQAAGAADLDYPRHHYRAPRVRHVVEENHVVHCTTTDLGLFTVADCGGGFDPLGIAGGR